MASKFDEAAYRGKLQQMNTNSLMSRIEGSGKHLQGLEASKLRREVLTVKEALYRASPERRQPDKVVKLHSALRGRRK